MLRKSLPSAKPGAPSVSAEESRLLNQINRGLPAEDLVRYHELIRKRQDQTIRPQEFTQLDKLTRQMEALQTQRLESLARLAELRRLSLRELMAQLEIQPPDVL